MGTNYAVRSCAQTCTVGDITYNHFKAKSNCCTGDKCNMASFSKFKLLSSIKFVLLTLILVKFLINF